MFFIMEKVQLTHFHVSSHTLVSSLSLDLMSFLCFIVELLHLNLISLKMLVYDATYGNLVLFSDRLKTALSKITQDCDQWIKPQTVSVSSSLPTSSGTTFTHMDVTPTSPPSHFPSSSLSLKVLHQTCHFWNYTLSYSRIFCLMSYFAQDIDACTTWNFYWKLCS